MSKILLYNSVSNVSVFVLKIIVAFFLTPVIVHALGNHDYGINEIVLSFIGYMGLLEIGFQPAVTRSVARYSAAGSKEDLQRVFSSALFFLVIVGMCVALVLLVWALIGAEGLVPEGANKTRYVYFLFIVACQVAVSFPGNVILCIHQGHQRYRLTNIVTIINTVIGATIIYIFLRHGYGLLFLTLANTIGLTIKIFVLGILLRKKIYGNYHFKTKYINTKTLKELLAFGSKSFALGVSSSFSKRASPMIIGSILGPATVVFYVLPYNLIGYLNNLVSAATFSFMPYFSTLHEFGDVQKTREVFLLSSRYVVGLSICGYLSMGFLGPTFLAAWVGPEYSEKGAMVLYLAAIWAFLRGINPFHGRILTGMNLHGSLAKIRSIEAAIYLVLSLILVRMSSIEGVALSVLLAAFIAEPFILHLVCRQIDWCISKYLKKVVFPLALPVVVLSTYYTIIMSNFNLSGYGSIVVVAASGCLIYFFIFIMSAINHQERYLIFQTLKKGISFILHPNLDKS